MKLFLPSRYSSSNCDATFLRAQREITTCSTSSSSLYSLSPPMTIKTLFPWSTRQNVLYYTFTQVTVQLRVALLLGWVKSCSFFKVLSVSHISLVPLSTPQHEEKGPSCGGEGGVQALRNIRFDLSLLSLTSWKRVWKLPGVHGYLHVE